MLNLPMNVLLTWWNTGLVSVAVCVSNFSVEALVVSYVYESLWFHKQRGQFLPCVCKQWSFGECRRQGITSALKANETWGKFGVWLVQCQNIRAIPYGEGGKSGDWVSSLSRHVNILALTFSCLYNEVLHKGKSPRHLYILLEAWLEMNKLIFACRVAEFKYVSNFCQRNAQSFTDPRSEKKIGALHISHACLSGCLASVKTPQRLFPKVLESCSGCTIFGSRISALKAVSRGKLAWQIYASFCTPWF